MDWFDALADLTHGEAAARVIRADGRWLDVSEGRMFPSYASAYAGKMLRAQLDGDDDLFFVGDGIAPHRWQRSTGEAAECTEADVPRQRPVIGPLVGAPSATSTLLDTALALGFTPSASEVPPSALVDAVNNHRLPGLVAERTVVGIPRRRSGFPFHEFEAFSGAGPLADTDAALAVRQLRDELETCDLVIAERWGRVESVDMAHEQAFVLDADAGMSFSPAAHTIGDWLQLAPAELAAGGGNLVVLARKFAESPELTTPDENGGLRSVPPTTENPWIAFLADAGALIRWRLRTER